MKAFFGLILGATFGLVLGTTGGFLIVPIANVAQGVEHATALDSLVAVVLTFVFGIILTFVFGTWGLMLGKNSGRKA